MAAITEEQNICIKCGLCCDNTLFDTIKIHEGDPYQNGELKIKESDDGTRYFELPCPFFNGKCAVYDKGTPKTCRRFRCQVLKNIEKGDLSNDRAEKIIDESKIARTTLIEDYKRISGNTLTFRQLSREMTSLDNENRIDTPELKLLSMKVDLLNVQLSKHFRSDDKFNDLYEILD